jgi:hypothetical protein
MSMSHKAFVFDWEMFGRELAPLLAASLEDGDTVRLVEFGDRHRHFLRDPYKGERLGENWPGSLGVGGIQEVADFVLTRYYHPTEDGGLGEAWQEIDARLAAEQRLALLGQTFGSEESLFDPGKMGSYFQDCDTARKSLELLRRADRPELSGFLSLLEKAVSSAKGLYVTF